MKLGIVFVSAIIAGGLSACATAPGAGEYVAAPVLQTEAALRDLRNAQARVRLARTVVDFDPEADADDVRELLAARDELRRLQSHDPTLAADGDPAYHPFGLPGYLESGGWTSGVLRFDGTPAPEANFTQERLSGLP